MSSTHVDRIRSSSQRACTAVRRYGRAPISSTTSTSTNVLSSAPPDVPRDLRRASGALAWDRTRGATPGDSEFAKGLRIEERELEAGALNLRIVEGSRGRH